MRNFLSAPHFALILALTSTTLVLAAPGSEAPPREGRELPASVLFAKLAKGLNHRQKHGRYSAAEKPHSIL